MLCTLGSSSPTFTKSLSTFTRNNGHSYFDNGNLTIFKRPDYRHPEPSTNFDCFVIRFPSKMISYQEFTNFLRSSYLTFVTNTHSHSSVFSYYNTRHIIITRKFNNHWSTSTPSYQQAFCLSTICDYDQCIFCRLFIPKYQAGYQSRRVNRFSPGVSDESEDNSVLNIIPKISRLRSYMSKLTFSCTSYCDKPDGNREFKSHILEPVHIIYTSKMVDIKTQ